MIFSPGASKRIFAMVLRYFYILKSSKTRLIEITYWPVMQVLLWGLISQFFMQSSPDPLRYAASAILGAVMLWDVCIRSQAGMSFSFLEEIWSRNLTHIIVSPLRTSEWIFSLATISMFRVMIGLIPAAALALALYHYSIFSLGFYLLIFFSMMVMMGWSIGLILNSLIFRYGQGVEPIAWMAIFMLTPFSAIYYPISILPSFLQPIAYVIPSSYIFEGMRELVQTGEFNSHFFFSALGLNILLLGLGLWSFYQAIKAGKESGSLTQYGE